MPFITEELWAEKGAQGPARREPVLALASWPDLSGLADEAAEAEIGWVVDLVSEIRSARSETNVPAGSQIPLLLVSPSAEVAARADAWAETIRRLARLSDITRADAAPKASVLLVRARRERGPAAGRRRRHRGRARPPRQGGRQARPGHRQKTRAKLDNPAFLQNAKEEVIEEQRERLEAALARKAKIAEARRRLGGVRNAGCVTHPGINPV